MLSLNVLRSAVEPLIIHSTGNLQPGLRRPLNKTDVPFVQMVFDPIILTEEFKIQGIVIAIIPKF